MIGRLTIGALLFAGVGTHPLGAQLAITEVMSDAAVNMDTLFKGPDYWELTNYGTNDLALDGYSFSDNRQTNGLVEYPFTNLVIHSGETILFFRCQPNHSVTNEAQFHAWWGGRLAPALQIRTYEAPGLNGEGGDEVWLYDPGLKVVDSVRFGQARPGRSFISDLNSGVFGVVSVPGVAGAFKAVPADDCGSPGTAPEPVALLRVQDPVNQTVDAGSSAMFTVVAYGLPRPKYQWFANGVPIPGATAAELTLSNVQPADEGAFWVQIHNGLEEITSGTATLSVNTNPTPPTIVCPPSDLTLFPGQTAVFSVTARGYSSPQYQWASNGVELPGATGPTLVVPQVTPGLNNTRYSVEIWNENGETNATATLTVVPRPRLRFTEVMAKPINDDSSGHYDWFELTNDDTNTVNLQGFRLFDTPTFQGAFTITAPLFIQPGESIVFVEEMSPERFWRWWGHDNYSPDIQVCSYRGFSLGDLGEALFLWNPACTDPYDPLATTSWAAATDGVSLECTTYCDPDYGCIGECLIDSIRCQSGTFAAAVNGDIGSPGRTSNPSPRILSITCEGPRVLLRCRVNVGRAYRLWCSPTLTGGTWVEVETRPASDCLLSMDVAGAETGNSRFYRLEELP